MCVHFCIYEMCFHCNAQYGCFSMTSLSPPKLARALLPRPPPAAPPPVSRLFPTGAGDDGVLLLQAAATAVHDAGGMTGGGPAPDRRAQCRSLAPRCCVWFGAYFPLKPRQSYGLLSHWFKADSFRSIIWGPFVSLAPPQRRSGSGTCSPSTR